MRMMNLQNPNLVLMLMLNLANPNLNKFLAKGDDDNIDDENDRCSFFHL